MVRDKNKTKKTILNIAIIIRMGKIFNELLTDEYKMVVLSIEEVVVVVLKKLVVCFTSACVVLSKFVHIK